MGPLGASRPPPLQRGLRAPCRSSLGRTAPPGPPRRATALRHNGRCLAAPGRPRRGSQDALRARHHLEANSGCPPLPLPLEARPPGGRAPSPSARAPRGRSRLASGAVAPAPNQGGGTGTSEPPARSRRGVLDGAAHPAGAAFPLRSFG